MKKRKAGQRMPIWVKSITESIPEFRIRCPEGTISEIAALYIKAKGEEWAKERMMGCYSKYLEK